VKDTPSPRPLSAKLGVKPGFALTILGGPPGFADLLSPLPDDVTLQARAAAGADLYVCFVRSVRELDTRLATLAPLIGSRILWFAWPKKASGTTTDLDGNIVRTRGLDAGLVDYKVCAIDATWSGLAFKRRNRF